MTATVNLNCIIVDDEPLAREGLQLMIGKTKGLTLAGSFNGVRPAEVCLAGQSVDLVFLDIQMPGMTGIEFARTIPGHVLVIFTTAYAEYALDSYEVEAIDYLVKPVSPERFQKAVDKALSYHQLLKTDKSDNKIGAATDDYFFVKAERKIFRVEFSDILFIEGLKDYVVIHTDGQKLITAMNIKTIHEQLPVKTFVRISKSYIINIAHIGSFDNNTVFIGKQEIPIGNSYRDLFFEEFVTRKLLSR